MKKSNSMKKSLKISILSLVLCIVMLIGTTFAWFTDSVTNSGNKIQAGHLDVTLSTWDGTEYKEVSKDPVFNHNNWEPGYTEMIAVKVANAGTLSLKYQVDFVSADKTAEANKLAEAIDVYYLKDGQAPEDLPSRFEELSGKGFTKLGTLSEFLNKTDGAATGKLDPNGADYAMIALHMQENAGNEYQGLNVGKGFDIILNATQLNKEPDGFGNPDYDENAEFATVVSAPEELEQAVEKGGIIELKEDITLGSSYLEVKKDVTILGNGNTLKAPETGDKKDRVINVTGTTEPVTITLKNVNIQGPTEGAYNRGISFYNTGEVNLVLDGCTVSTNYYALNIASECKDVNVTIKNSTMTGWAAAQTHSPNAEIKFENCRLVGNNDFSYNAEGWNNFATLVVNQTAGHTILTLDHCTIEANQTTGNQQYYLSLRSEENTVEFNDCKFINNGTEQTIEEALKNIQLYSANNSIRVNGEEVVSQ